MYVVIKRLQYLIVHKLDNTNKWLSVEETERKTYDQALWIIVI